MLNTILHDIYCLKRVHAIFPDQVLGHTLKDKIMRINLKPALEEVKQKSQDTVLLSSMKRRVQNDEYDEEMENLSMPSSPSTLININNSTSNVDMTGSNAIRQSNSSATAAASLANNEMTKWNGEWLGNWSGRFVGVPNPSSLANLLECLAYFELGKSDITHDTLKLIEFILPYMTINQLSNTLAAACALGEQGVTVPTTALLNAALHVNESTKVPSSSTSPIHLSSPHNSTVAWRSEFDQSEIGRNVIRLMKALQRAEVKQEEIWALIAEHCIRYIQYMTARQLLSIVEIFSAEQMTYYPDFYIAAEKYITSQPAYFMNMEQLQRMVNYFKAVNQPVMSLLALSTNRFDAGFEQSLNALANMTQRGGFMDKEQALHELLPYTYGNHSKFNVTNNTKHLSQKEQMQGESRRKTKTESTQKQEEEESNETESNEQEQQHSHLSSKENDVVIAFLNVAIPAFGKANGNTLLNLLIQCDEKKIMHPRLMETAIHRVQELYFHETITLSSSSYTEGTSTQEEMKRVDRKAKFARMAEELLPRDVNEITSLIEKMLHFTNPAFFAHERSTMLLMDMLDSIAGRTIEHFHHRLLRIAECACQLVPSEELLPRHYFAVLINYLKETRDMVTTTLINGARIELFVRSLFQLKPYGGLAVIEYYLPIITVEATKAVLHVQVRLAEMLSTLPAAKSELLPSLFRAIVGQKRWAMMLLPQEIGELLRAMRNGGVRHAGLLAGMMQIMTSRKQLFHGHDVVEYLVHLAILGEREVEFFTTMATYVLESGNSGSIANSISINANSVKNNSNKKKTKNEINGSNSSGSNAEGMSMLQQSTSVHDLCTLLYVFTFIVKDVIRVVQQILARLKVSVSQVNAEDVVKVLYSLVKLHVTRHYEITNPLCDRMVKLCKSCTAQELSSVWSSLRTLNFYHAALTEDTRHVIEEEAAFHIVNMAIQRASTKQHPDSQELVGKPKMSDKTFVAIITAMVQITISNVEQTQMSNGTQPIVQGKSNITSTILPLITNSKSVKTSQDLQYDQLHDNSNSAQIQLLQCSHPFSKDTKVQIAFKEATVRLFVSMIINTKFVEQPLHGINNRVAPREVSGLHICLTIHTLVYFSHINLTEYEWNVLAAVANYYVTFLSRGNAETNCFAAVDTLIALTRLRQQWSEHFVTKEKSNANAALSTRDKMENEETCSSSLETLLQEYTNNWLDHIPTELLRFVQDKQKVVLTSYKVRSELRELGLLSRITGHNDLHHQMGSGSSSKRSLYSTNKRGNIGGAITDGVGSMTSNFETEMEKATASAHAFWHATAVQEEVSLTTPLINKRVKKSEDMVTRLRKGAHVARERKRLTSSELEERLSSINTDTAADVHITTPDELQREETTDTLKVTNVKDKKVKTKIKEQTHRVATGKATKSKSLTSTKAEVIS